MRFIYKAPFLKAFDKILPAEQELVGKADQLIKEYLVTSRASFGLRIKKLRDGIFEARVSSQLRILWVRDKASDTVSFALLGNHEDVQRFLKSL